MDLYRQKDKSIPQKIMIHFIEVILLWLSYWILFQSGGDWIENHLVIENSNGNVDRRIIIFIFHIIIFIRLSYMMIFILKRKMPWEESLSITLAFALYFIGFSLFVLPFSQSLDVLDLFAIAIFILGCVLNSVGEILRNQWKMKPENKGRLYTKGFFKYSRHINYFGDILWVIGYSLITKNIWSITIPVFLFCFFAFYNAPKLDRYLKEKYGNDYNEYAKTTKMLVPFIY